MLKSEGDTKDRSSPRQGRNRTIRRLYGNGFPYIHLGRNRLGNAQPHAFRGVLGCASTDGSTMVPSAKTLDADLPLMFCVSVGTIADLKLGRGNLVFARRLGVAQPSRLFSDTYVGLLDC